MGCFTCSSASHSLSVPRHNLSLGSRAFRISAPKYGIPYRLTFCSLKHSLHLKTHYFQSAYPAPQHPSPMRPDSLLRLWRYINHLLTYFHAARPCYRSIRNITKGNDRRTHWWVFCSRWGLSRWCCNSSELNVWQKINHKNTHVNLVKHHKPVSVIFIA